MVKSSLRIIFWTRVFSRAGEIMKVDTAAGFDLLAVYCAALTIARTVG